MNILLLGATGATGKEVLRQSLAAGDKVTIVVRTPSNVHTISNNLRMIEGDATDAKILADAMEDNDAVISTLGSMSNGTLIADSTRAMIAAAEATGLRRILMMSSFAVNRGQLTRPAKFITNIVLHKVLIDKAAGEAKLRASRLDWTIVYATILTDDPIGVGARIVPLSEHVGMRSRIARADVAAWLLASLQDARYVRKSVTLSR